MEMKDVLEVFLPKDTLTHFDVTRIETTDKEVHITLAEKNIPPDMEGMELRFKGYKDIIVSDFPIRGKRGILTYRRRYWQVPGSEQIVTSNIPLVFPGTKIESAFAEILKKRGGDDPDFLGEYRHFIPIAPKGV